MMTKCVLMIVLALDLLASPVFAKDVIVWIPACDRAARQGVEVHVVLDDETFADHPELEALVRDALFQAAAEADFPGPDSYAVFVAGLRGLPQDLQDDITDQTHIQYTGATCR